jgi:hypothetical protein
VTRKPRVAPVSLEDEGGKKEEEVAEQVNPLFSLDYDPEISDEEDDLAKLGFS